MLSRLAKLSFPPALTRVAAAIRGTRPGRWLWPRGRIVVVAVLAAALAHCATASPPARTTTGVAEFLGRAVGGEVGADDFVWEERSGLLGDAIWGRRVLFLARPRGQWGRDLYRARVRLTRGGRALSVGGLRNLSSTPLDDDGDLTARGSTVVVSMRSDHEALGVRVYDLSGEGADRSRESWLTRLRAGIENILQSGRARGMTRTEIAFQEPPRALRFELEDDALVLALGEEGEPASLDLRSGALNPGPKNPYGASVRSIPHRAGPASSFMGEAARPLVGPALAGMVEEVWLRAGDRKDALRRPASLSAWSVAATEEGPGGWPPPRAAAPAHFAGNADGGWRPAMPSHAGEGALPLAYETAVSGANGAIVRMVALDTRQLDLGYAPGFEEPRVSLGPRGSGQVPEGGVVVVFNGASSGRARSSTGELGAAAFGRILAPALPGGDAVAIDRRGAVLAGAFESAPPLSLFPSWRQTDDAWMGGEIPRRPAPCDRCAIERSALGVTSSGMLVYAWSPRAVAADLRDALAGVGCDVAIPLAIRPANVGIAFMDPPGADDATHPEAIARKLDPAMSFAPPSLGHPSAEEFFYATIRDLRPRAPLPSGGGWMPDSGTLPAPTWLPAIHEASVTSLGAQVHLAALAKGRFVFRLRAGGKEIVASKSNVSLPTALEGADVERAIAALGLGTGHRKGPRGLAVGGVVGLPIRGEGALLVVDPEHATVAIELSKEGASIAATADATELPLTGEEGKLLPSARTLGSMRSRAAACILEDGTFVVASTTFDSDEANTAVLLDLGCKRVAALDRGSHAPAFIRQRGEHALATRDEETVLYAVASDVHGRAAATRPLAK